MPRKCYVMCGKGGVGKTVCACALGLALSARGHRTLVISTDVISPIGDIFQVDAKSRPVEITSTLHVQDLTREDIISLWKERFGKEVYEVLSSFLPVEEDIVDYIANAPGIDELFTTYYIYDLARSGKYDTIVWDTAPGSGTLHLLRLLKILYTHLIEAESVYGRLLNFLMRARSLVESLRRRESRDPISLIKKWRNLVEEVEQFLKNETEFILITTPEKLSLTVCKNIKRELENFGIKVRKLVINQVIRDISEHIIRKRLENMLETMKLVDSELPEVEIKIEVPALEHDVRGICDVEKLVPYMLELVD